MLLYSHVSQLATLDLSNCIMRYSLCTLDSEFPLDWETFECYLFTVDNLRGRHGEFTMSKESHMKVERTEISRLKILHLSVSLYSAFASLSLSLEATNLSLEITLLTKNQGKPIYLWADPMH